jgi:DNA-binding NtrC family response regulator
MVCLQRHEFPGNIRELRNRLERAALLADGDQILPEHLSDDCMRAPPHGDDMPTELLPLEEMERRYLARIVATHAGDRRALAEKLGISERTLYRKLQQLRIE